MSAVALTEYKHDCDVDSRPKSIQSESLRNEYLHYHETVCINLHASHDELVS